MWSTGTDVDTSVRPASQAFARLRKPFGAKRWLAALPLAAVAIVTFNGSAPAGASAEPEVSVAPAPQAEGRWSRGDLRDLVEAADKAAAEGLNPADYNVEALRAAVDAKQTGLTVDAIANAAALRLANDFANGRIADREAFDWHIAAPVAPEALVAGLNDALDHDRLGKWLNGLLPDNDQYRALRTAYASSSDPMMREKIAANMERWRWMPRDLGDRYIYVNVPSYRLSLMNDGSEEASFNVIVGSPKTPTPQLALHAQTVVANPSWTVPQSIIKSGGVRGKGFTWKKLSDGSFRVQQAPGPTNALGRIKIDMPNPHAIYLHDTPNRAAFGRTNRALSHGCVRVENIAELATMLDGGAPLDEALSDPRRTVRFELEKSVPVYIVYFTLEAGPDGILREVGDPYGRDQAMLGRMMRPAGGSTQVAVR
jgi:L,D-transpeptidase YcbB